MVDLQKLPTNWTNQGLNAEKATTELCPPNPNEFDMAGKVYTETSVSKLQTTLSAKQIAGKFKGGL